MTNIAEGRGTSIDAAKFMRESGHGPEHMAAAGIPMKERVAEEGAKLSKLPSEHFDRVVSGELPAERGAVIGGSGLSHDEQRGVFKMLAKRGINNQPTNKVLHNYIEDVREAPNVEHRTKSLFGEDTEAVNLGMHKADVRSYIQDRLSREKRLFGTVAKSRNASELERGGNAINAEQSGKIADEAKANLDTYEAMRKLKGPVSELENEAALRIHKGEHHAKVKEDVYRRLPAAVQAIFAGTG